MKKVFLFFIFILAIIACDDHDNNKNNNGFTIANFCFTTQGGNTSNYLRADANWKIVVPGYNPWVTFKPSQGTASENLINVIMTATVNNDPGSRSTDVMVIIGTDTISYNCSQDGTQDQVCWD